MTAGPLVLRPAARSFGDRPTASQLGRIDPFLLVASLLLIGYGLVMTYSSSAEAGPDSGDPWAAVARAAVFAAVGLGLMAAVALLDYSWLGTLAPLLYLLTIGFLAVVLVMGETVFGGQRWMIIAGQKLQVSEFAKVLMIVVLARWFADRHDRVGSPLVLAGAAIVLAPAVLLVYRQPDLGTSLVFVAIFFGIAFMAGARLWQLTALVAAGAGAFPLVWSLLRDYQRARLVAFIDPYADPQGTGWNILQSLIAVGSGQATGKGLTAGTQSPLGYLPIADSDFVFAGLAEDLGFLGAILLFALYLVLLVAALRVAYRARDPFGSFLASGVVAMLGFQIVVNVGMSISLMPVTGIPLPFISRGGSSLLSICLALGVLQSVAMRREGS